MSKISKCDKSTKASKKLGIGVKAYWSRSKGSGTQTRMPPKLIANLPCRAPHTTCCPNRREQSDCWCSSFAEATFAWIRVIIQGRIDDWSGGIVVLALSSTKLYLAPPLWAEERRINGTRNFWCKGKHRRFQSTSAAPGIFYLFIFW